MMGNVNNIDQYVYHDIDVLLPTHKFNIAYTYAASVPMEFIRAFTLRLLKIGPTSAEQIAFFMGLTIHELKSNLDDLINRQEVTINDQQLFCLTPKSLRYFINGPIPEVENITDQTSTLSFELLDFNLIRNNNLSTWSNGIILPADKYKIANSGHEVSKRFQMEFFRYLELNHISLNNNGAAAVLYKISSVEKISDSYFRFPLLPRINIKTGSGDLNWLQEQDLLTYSSVITETIEEVIGHLQQINNVNELRQLAQTYSVFSVLETVLMTRELSITNLIGYVMTHNKKLSDTHYFIGPIYRPENFKKFCEVFEASRVRALSKSSKDEALPELLWLAPDDAFWGKSEYFKEVIKYLADNSKWHSSKNTKDQYHFKLSLPIDVDEIQDRHAGKEKLKLIDQGYHQYMYGHCSTILSGGVELILMPKRFVYVGFHIRTYELDVTFPFGFMTTDVSVINAVAESLEDQVSSSGENWIKPTFIKIGKPQSKLENTNF